MVTISKKSIPSASNNHKWLPALNLAAYAANTAVSYAVGASGLFGLPDNATLSRKYQTLVTPAGWAFAIWGLIFAAQLVWAVHPQFATFATSSTHNHISAVGFQYVGVCVAQIAWTVAFATERVSLSLLCMMTILYFLQRIDSARPAAAYANTTGTSTTANYWIYRFPLALHYGWICAATAVNASVVLVAWHVSAAVQFYAAVGSLTALFGLAFFKLFQAFDYTVPAVIVHALLGIFAELRHSVDDDFLSQFSDGQVDVIRYGSLFAATLILIFLVMTGV